MKEIENISDLSESMSHKFDLYSKKVIRHCVINEIKKYNRNIGFKKEILVNEKNLNGYYEDEYKTEKIAVNIGEMIIYLENEKIVEALMSIRKKQRETIIMSIVYGMSVKEIAEFLRVNDRTVIEYKSIGLRKMREFIEKNNA